MHTASSLVALQAAEELVRCYRPAYEALSERMACIEGNEEACR